MSDLDENLDLSVKNPNKQEESDERTPREIAENISALNGEVGELINENYGDCGMKKDGWKYCKLGDVGTFQRGGNFKKADFVENGFPCIHYGQIHTTFGVSTETHLSSVPTDLVKKGKCAKKGDLIIAITSEDEECSCKCTAWLGDYDVYVGGHAAIFRHNLNPVFMSYYFRSPQFNKLKLEYTHGFKVVEINPKDIAKIPIAYPDSLFDQQQIVKYLDSTFKKIEKTKEDAEQIIKECDRLKQAILKQVFE